MASPTQWWASSGRSWRTGKPGMLQPMGSQRVRYNLATEQLGLSSCGAMYGSVLAALRPSYSVAGRVLVPWPGIEPVSPKLQGGLSTTREVPWMFLMPSRMVSPFQKILSWLCPDPSEESPSMAAKAWWKVKMKSLSRVRLCDPVDCSPPGFSVHGILQARILAWVTISFSRGSSRPRDQTQVSHIGGRRFNLWATREAQALWNAFLK